MVLVHSSVYVYRRSLALIRELYVELLHIIKHWNKTQWVWSPVLVSTLTTKSGLVCLNSVLLSTQIDLWMPQAPRIRVLLSTNKILSLNRRSKFTLSARNITLAMLKSHSHTTLTSGAQLPIQKLPQVRITMLANTSIFNSKTKTINESNADSNLTLGTSANKTNCTMYQAIHSKRPLIRTPWSNYWRC